MERVEFEVPRHLEGTSERYEVDGVVVEHWGARDFYEREGAIRAAVWVSSSPPEEPGMTGGDTVEWRQRVIDGALAAFDRVKGLDVLRTGEEPYVFYDLVQDSVAILLKVDHGGEVYVVRAKNGEWPERMAMRPSQSTMPVVFDTAEDEGAVENPF